MAMDDNIDKLKFFSEILDRQVSEKEFFNNVLLKTIENGFGFKKILISYFDTHGNFLSWVNKDGIYIDHSTHPYHNFIANDIVRNTIYQKAVADQLTYFNLLPRLYKSTDIIDPIDYEHSGYVRFLEDNFQQHYSVTLAFGINAYIQVSFFKDKSEGDFNHKEISLLHEIYIYIANSYKNFKKYEQAKIISNIQNEIILTGERAYLITDDFMHIMNSNKLARTYLNDILGLSISEDINSEPNYWLSLLLDKTDNNIHHNDKTKTIKNYLFKIKTYKQTYSNGIVDIYHWITIIKNEKQIKNDLSISNLPLTNAEQKITELLYNGLTYQDIAKKLNISYHTVKKHIQNIYIKCEVNSRFQLYKWIEDKHQK